MTIANYCAHNARTTTSRTLRARRQLDIIKGFSRVVLDAVDGTKTMNRDWLRLRRDQGALMNEMVRFGMERPEGVIHAHMQGVRSIVAQLDARFPGGSIK